MEETARATRQVAGHVDALTGDCRRTDSLAESSKSAAAVLSDGIEALAEALTQIVRTSTEEANRRAHTRHPCSVSTGACRLVRQRRKRNSSTYRAAAP